MFAYRIAYIQYVCIVSINSTSYKGSGVVDELNKMERNKFPLIPLPIKEAVKA